jgi:hypothetical protein
MNFKNAATVQSMVQQMKLADLPRSKNRALINNLFNGEAPYTPEEVNENGIEVNVNFLDGTEIIHKARSQFSNAFLSTARYFGVTVDCGPAWKRQSYSEIITAEINRRLKRSLRYRETLRNVFGQVVLHGIGPAVWDSQTRWCPDMLMLGDVLMPSKTLLTMENVDYFTLYRRYTAEKLWSMTHGPMVDPGWTVPLADKCIEWARKQVGKQVPNSNDQIYSPERVAEDMKSDSGLYASDATPTIDCWDFYYRCERDKESGWQRKIVLDVPEQPDGEAVFTEGKNAFLYDGGSRVYAPTLDRLIHFQYADGNQVAPFRFHSVRSLGWLLYAVCELQNRFRCRLNEHAFENMLQYLRVSNLDDAERMLKLNLMNKGIIPDGVSMVPQTERWQINQGVAELVLSQNRNSMQTQSASYTQDYERQRQQSEKTATEVMAEVNASSALVGAMLNEAYGYQEFQYTEIARRFCLKSTETSDGDVLAFRAECLRQGVPEEALDINKWQIKAERVMGGGNKQLQTAQAKALMEVYGMIPPPGQRIILRNYVFAITSDPALTDSIVPPQPDPITDSVHDAQLAAGTLLQGLPVGIKNDFNQVEYIETMLASLAAALQQVDGKMPTEQQIIGYQTMADHIGQHIQILSQNPQEQERARKYGDDLGQMNNIIKGHIQRFMEQQEEQQAQGDPAIAAKIQALSAETDAKIRNMDKLTASKLEAQEAKHQLQMVNKIRDAEVKETVADIKTAAELRRDGVEAAKGPAAASET